MEISCIVLAGGKSTRLGRNKLVEVIGRKTLLEMVLDALSVFNSEIIVVTSRHSPLSPMLKQYPRARTVEDIFPDTGSLGGIYTGLSVSRNHYNLVVAADLPFLNINLLKYMVSIAPGFDLVAYNENDRPEMLHAVYSKNCLAPMESLIRRNNLRIIGILPSIKVRYLTLAEIEQFDPRHLSFFNINTEDDLKKGLELARKLSPSR
jgi:molybdenum cofactor guanylyltransferase